MQEKLKHLRQVYNYTQQEMAKHLGITLRTYQNKETGKSLFTSEEIHLIQRDIEKLKDWKGKIWKKNILNDINRMEAEITI